MHFSRHDNPSLLDYNLKLSDGVSESARVAVLPVSGFIVILPGIIASAHRSDPVFGFLIRPDAVRGVIIHFNSVNLQTVSRIAVYSIVDVAAGYIGSQLPPLICTRYLRNRRKHEQRHQ